MTQLGKKIFIYGPASPASLGDACQYGIANFLLNIYFPKMHTILSCPDLENNKHCFDGIPFNSQLMDLSNIGFLTIWKLLRSSISAKNFFKAKMGLHAERVPRLSVRSTLYQKFSKHFPRSLGLIN